MDDAYAIASDCERVQLPTFYPDASHYLYHQPESFDEHYSQGLGQMREMQHSGSSPPEVLRGMEHVVPLSTPSPTSVTKTTTTPKGSKIPVSKAPQVGAQATTEAEPNNRLRNFLLIVLGLLLVLGLVTVVGRIFSQ